MSRFITLSPLENFFWKGGEYHVPEIGTITHFDESPELHGLDRHLNEYERSQMGVVHHWLVSEQEAGDEVKAGGCANLFLLGLWLSIFTKAHIKFRFEFAVDQPAEVNNFMRLHDRFEYVPDHVEVMVDDVNVGEAALFAPVLKEIYLAHRRLRPAVSLCIAACLAYRWDAKVMLFSAVAETLLTYSTGPGITARLARSYACLTETASSERNAAYREFRALYNVRSDIIHGRIGNVPDSEHLEAVHRFSVAVRKLWRVVLSDDGISAALEGDDPSRQAFFDRIESGYSNPT